MVPLATPARVRTAVSFRLINAVADSPSSVFTADREMGPELGKVM